MISRVPIYVDIDKIVDAARDYLRPEDIFQVEELEGWAEDNGFIRRDVQEDC